LYVLAKIWPIALVDGHQYVYIKNLKKINPGV
jgi:hypothetical protein